MPTLAVRDTRRDLLPFAVPLLFAVFHPGVARASNPFEVCEMIRNAFIPNGQQTLSEDGCYHRAAVQTLTVFADPSQQATCPSD